MSKKEDPPRITKVKDCMIDMPFFNRFVAAELDVLAYKMELRHLKLDEFIFNEGDPGDFMGFVAKGELAVVKKNNQGKTDLRLAHIRKGFTFGEMALADNFPRSASIVAQAPSDLLILTQEKLDALCEQHPKIALKILQGINRLLSLNLRRTSGALTDYLGK